jgi:single-strand DNA-binding protein
MAEGVNKVILLGNLGADPDLRSTQGGQSVLRLRLATTERYLDQNKEWKERTEWHNVTVWGKRGEALHRILTKGSTIYVDGSLRTTSYDKDGTKVYKTEVVAQNIVLTGGRGGGGAERGGGYDAGPPAQRSGGGGGYGGGRPAQPAAPRTTSQEDAPGDDYDAYNGSDDDIPFLTHQGRPPGGSVGPFPMIGPPLASLPDTSRCRREPGGGSLRASPWLPSVRRGARSGGPHRAAPGLPATGPPAPAFEPPRSCPRDRDHRGGPALPDPGHRATAP